VADLKDKVQRIYVLEKDFVGMAAYCDLPLIRLSFPLDCSSCRVYLVSLSDLHSCFLFAEKINFLESKISSYQIELQSRARIIFELKNHLEAEKLNNNFQPELEEISTNQVKCICISLIFICSSIINLVVLFNDSYLKKTLLVKDEIIDRLTSEKQVSCW
jgi:hypothetical protein